MNEPTEALELQTNASTRSKEASVHNEALPNDRPACFASTTQEVMTVAILTCGVGLYSITAGSVQAITDTIGQDLRMEQAEITWLANAPNLTAGSYVIAESSATLTVLKASCFCLAPSATSSEGSASSSHLSRPSWCAVWWQALQRTASG
jgi:hypothetical protein